MVAIDVSANATVVLPHEQTKISRALAALCPFIVRYPCLGDARALPRGHGAARNLGLQRVFWHHDVAKSNVKGVSNSRRLKWPYP